VNEREGACRSNGTLGSRVRLGNLGRGVGRNGRRGGILSSDEAAEHFSGRKDFVFNMLRE